MNAPHDSASRPRTVLITLTGKDRPGVTSTVFSTLARFNVESDEADDHMHFQGLPSPAAAASIAGFAILFYELRREDTPLLFNEEIDRAVPRNSAATMR